MRVARTMFLIAATAVAAFAMTTGTASAQLEVHSEDGDPACGTVALVGHDVSGGCHVEFVGTEHIPLVVFTPSRVLLSNCAVSLEAQLGENGQGYVTEASLTESVGEEGDCTRAPCDEANGQMRPWPVTLGEAAGTESVEATFCLRLADDPAGSPGTQCEVHLGLQTVGVHSYEIGADPSVSPCEVSPIPPAVVAIEDAHFIQINANEDVEIVH